MAKGERRGQEFFERVLSERTRDGLTWKALSARTGVPLSTLLGWSTRLKKRGYKPKAFVEVVSSPAPDDRIEVVLRGGHRLLITTAAGGRFRELIADLEAC